MKNVPRIYLTGVGVVASATLQNKGPAAFWQRFSEADTPLDKRIARRGIRYKDRATRLALRASQLAFADAGLPELPSDRVDQEEFGIMASSNFGNLDTIELVAKTIWGAGAAAAPVMHLPNASSNVIATTASIWFGCKALNLMFSSGSTSGAEAIAAAIRSLQTGRAQKILVVASEVRNACIDGLLNLASRPDTVPDDLGVALILETEASAYGRGAQQIHAEVREFSTERQMPWQLLHLRDFRLSELPPVPQVPTEELATTWGDYYGAQALLHAAFAAFRLEQSEAAAVLSSVGASACESAVHLLYEAPH